MGIRRRRLWSSTAVVATVMLAVTGTVAVTTRASAAEGWVHVATGENSTCAIQTDGSLWCWGDNTYGKLGVGDLTDRLVPTRVGSSTSWVDVTVGRDHACAVKTSGSRYCWGFNEDGKLGLDSSASYYLKTPTKAEAGEPSGGWWKLSAGRHHTCGITKSGNYMYCWGRGADGRLGTGNTRSRDTPTLADGDKWKAVSAGHAHTCGIKLRHGEAYCWGDNSYAQIGNNSSADRSDPTRVATPEGIEWISISAGGNFSCGVRNHGDEDGRALCWGRNEDRILGTASAQRLVGQPWTVWYGDSGIQSVSAGYNHSCAVMASTIGMCWGNSQYGQVGVKIDCFGCSRVVDHPVQAPVGGAALKEISAGGYHSCAIGTVGHIWCWGRNDQGQLGFGDRVDWP